MRIYAKADIPKLREQMVEAGFRFKDEKGVMTTREMAKLLSVAQSTLRRAERLGRIPTQSRDTNGKRKWKRGDVRKLKRLLARSSSTLRGRKKL